MKSLVTGKAKESLRARLLAERAALGEAEASSKSAAVQERFLLTDAYRAARSIALYSSVRGEVSTRVVLAQAFEDGKEVCLPVTDVGVDSDGGDGICRIHFAVLSGDADLHVGPHGIKEPSRRAPRREVAEIDCIVMPGVAFDRRGARLGHGAGCYDRALAGGKDATTVGFAYAFQITDEELPIEDHDVRVGMVVTEEEIIMV